MVPDLTVRAPGPQQPWDPAAGLLPAQAAYCYRRTLESVPSEVGALIGLHDAFKARRMDDAQRSVIALIRSAWPVGRGLQNKDAAGEQQLLDPPLPPIPAAADRQGLVRALSALLEGGRPEAAVRLFNQAEARPIKPDWPASDRVAVAQLYLGYPLSARAIWTRAAQPPSRALQRARIATADLAALDYESALAGYRAALENDPALGEAWFGLAMVHTQLGQAAPALSAARQGLNRELTEAQKSFLTGIAGYVEPYAAD
jgi:tetratricopeptide (TPR) repeat protein